MRRLEVVADRSSISCSPGPACPSITFGMAPGGRARAAANEVMTAVPQSVTGCGTAKPDAHEISDAEGVLELLWLLLTTVLAWARPRHDLVLENLLLRHQLAVLTRPTRTRPRARLRIWDKLLWVLARQWCAGWREHLRIVTPDTVVRWPSAGLATVLALEVPLA